jgi:hypothetical protein
VYLYLFVCVFCYKIFSSHLIDCFFLWVNCICSNEQFDFILFSTWFYNNIDINFTWIGRSIPLFLHTSVFFYIRWNAQAKATATSLNFVCFFCVSPCNVFFAATLQHWCLWVCIYTRDRVTPTFFITHIHHKFTQPFVLCGVREYEYICIDLCLLPTFSLWVAEEWTNAGWFVLFLCYYYYSQCAWRDQVHSGNGVLMITPRPL